MDLKDFINKDIKNKLFKKAKIKSGKIFKCSHLTHWDEHFRLFEFGSFVKIVFFYNDSIDSTHSVEIDVPI